MNNIVKRVTAAGLCGALCLSVAGVALAGGRSTDGQQEVPSTVQASTAAAATGAPFKDETVYVLTAADGTVEKVIVSDFLQNTSGSAALADRSTLTQIENVKGDETYETSGQSDLLWDAQGGDICYQGRTEAEPPIALRVSYQLDGEPIDASALAGKSGRVTIRFDYENRQLETVSIDGQEESLCVPFVVLSGLVLDGDTFRNVTVSNGKLLCDGDRTFVLGYALPGLASSLGLSDETLSLPDFVEITADVTDFALGATVTVALSDLWNDLDLSALGNAGSLGEQLSALTDAVAQLSDGSSALYDGLCEALDAANALSSGVDQLASGSKSVRDGADSLSTGAAQLSEGLSSLSDGLSALRENSAGLNLGAQQVFQTLLASATAQLQSAGLPVPALTSDNYAAVLGALVDTLTASGAADSAQSVAALKTSLDSYSAFYQGLCAYTAGVDEAAAGALELSSGASALQSGCAQVRSGASAVYDGAAALQSALPALTDGMSQLRDGAASLRDGLTQFDEQVISRLSALSERDLAGLSERLQASVDLSRRYRNFSGLADGTEGRVKFIYRTEEIA